MNSEHSVIRILFANAKWKHQRLLGRDSSMIIQKVYLSPLLTAHIRLDLSLDCAYNCRDRSLLSSALPIMYLFQMLWKSV